ncbi:hypothetical protein QCA50_013260 [Cerrena zonata]|uniref:Uncharacterized protein n=1 Tax=Cerrena zonata TaxID=2478898 RepID=A0AAW0FVI2_9APHY
MIYGGSIQFGILLLLNILAVLLDVLAVASNSTGGPDVSAFINIQQALTSIVLSHFILNLRSIYHTTSNPLQTSSRQSSLYFASAIEGNMGATLSASFGSSRGEEKETEEIQYSAYPFSTGLADIKEINTSENMEEILDASPPSTTHNAEPLSSHPGPSTSAAEEEIELQEIV